MSSRPLPSSYHYVRFTATPSCTDAVTVRKSIQDALGQTFGTLYANTYVDILWIADDGSETVVRVAARCAVLQIYLRTRWANAGLYVLQ